MPSNNILTKVLAYKSAGIQMYSKSTWYLNFNQLCHTAKMIDYPRLVGIADVSTVN